MAMGKTPLENMNTAFLGVVPDSLGNTSMLSECIFLSFVGRFFLFALIV